MTRETLTRDEWAARKDAARPELLALYAKGTAADAAEKAQADAIWDATAQLLADRRQEFEAELARLLDREGAGWLAEYRAPDSSFAGPHRLDLNHRGWFALFDLTQHGFHPVRVEMHNDCARHNWQPARAPWGVELPQGIRWCSTLAEAVRCAGRFVDCPF